MPDINLTPYEYSERGRRPGAWLLTGLGAVFLAFALWQGAPWPLFVPLGFYIACCLWLLARNRVAGMRIDAQSWSFQGPGAPGPVPVAGIDHVSVTRWSDGPGDVRIHLSDGSVIQPPAICLPTADALIPELRRARIAVRER